MELRFEKWGKVILGVIGTIRTVPENYYVASVCSDRLTFIGEKGLEANTRNIDQDYVCKWANEHIFNNGAAK